MPEITTAGTIKLGLKKAFLDHNFTEEQSEIFSSAAAAQYALESSWGKRKSNNFNFFGIKSSEKGNTATKEVRNGKVVTEYASFASYDSIEDGLNGYVEFITKNKRYAKAGLFESTSVMEYATRLQKAGYATDPEYANKLVAIATGKRMKQEIESVNI